MNIADESHEIDIGHIYALNVGEQKIHTNIKCKGKWLRSNNNNVYLDNKYTHITAWELLLTRIFVNWMCGVVDTGENDNHGDGSCG